MEIFEQCKSDHIKSLQKAHIFDFLLHLIEYATVFHHPPEVH